MLASYVLSRTLVPTLSRMLMGAEPRRLRARSPASLRTRKRAKLHRRREGVVRALSGRYTRVLLALLLEPAALYPRVFFCALRGDRVLAVHRRAQTSSRPPTPA